MAQDGPKSTNLTYHPPLVTRAEREASAGHRGCTVWLTGLSASGKSTIATALEQTWSLPGSSRLQLGWKVWVQVGLVH